MQVPRKRKASDPEENFEVDEHGNLIKDYGASPDIPSLSVGGYKDPTVAAMERYYTPEIQQKVADFWGETPQQLPLASPYTAQPTGMSFPGALELQRRAEAEQTPMTQVVSPSTGFADQTVPAPPGADPNYQPGMLAALNRELGGAMSNITDPAWLNRKVGGAMSSVGDVAGEVGSGVKNFLSNTGDALYNMLPSREGVRGFLDVLGNVGLASTHQGAIALREMQMRRDVMQQNIMQQMAQQQEQKRQHDMMMIWRLAESGNIEAMKMFGKETGNQLATNMAQALNEADLRQLTNYVKRGWVTPQEMQEAKDWTPSQIRAKVNLMKKREAVIDEAKFKNAALMEAYEKQKAGQADQFDTELIKEHKAERAKTEAETEAKLAEAELKRYKIAHGGGDSPDRTTLNRAAQMVSGGRGWDELNAAGEFGLMNQAYQKAAQMYAQGRTDVQMSTPAPIKERSGVFDRNKLAENLDLRQAPPGISEGDLRKGEFVELSEKEQSLVSDFKIAKKTSDSVFKTAEALITAKKPTEAAVQAATLWGGAMTGSNPVAAAYVSDLESLSSRIARLVEVGVMTDRDVNRWKSVFPSFGDTVSVLQTKRAIFNEIQNEAERLMKMRLSGKSIEGEKSELEAILNKTNQLSRTKEPTQKLSPQQLQNLFKTLPPLEERGN